MAEISGSCQIGECEQEAEFLIIETLQARPNMGFPALERKRKACRDCWNSTLLLQAQQWVATERDEVKCIRS